MGNRRRARELALQTLYALERQPNAIDEAVANMQRWAKEAETPEADNAELIRGSDDIQAFAEKIVRGVASNLEAIDTRIGQCSTNWKVPRMAAVDRNILRLATYELMHLGDIPPKVTLNEAIEIAKRYGTEDSGAFINGILDRIASLEKSPTAG